MGETQEAGTRITPLAAEKAKEILARYGKEHAAIRVYIKSGGCSGFQYGMAVDERELPGDTFVEMHGVHLRLRPLLPHQGPGGDPPHLRALSVRFATWEARRSFYRLSLRWATQGAKGPGFRPL